ncbi:MAG: hypothetical protein IE913_02425 [Halothiobacillus sp.]|nr:hypothetical protein [Halothiobacillus sp.]
MSPAVPEVLQSRLDVLQRLGVVVDEAAARWLPDQTGRFDQEALNSIAEARRVIELTVDLALAHGCAEAPAVLAMRKAWEDRFATIASAIKQKHTSLTESAQIRSRQTQAVKAYIGTKGLGQA